MWTVIKFDDKKIEFLKKDFKRKLGEDIKIYIPKFTIQKYRNNIKIIKEYNLLGDYLFCFHKKFEDSRIKKTLRFSRGLKYFLTGSTDSQSEISEFIKRCKESEDKSGYITKSFFELYINSNYEFISGPFGSKIFEIINLQKNKIDILLGNIKVKINRSQYLFVPV